MESPWSSRSSCGAPPAFDPVPAGSPAIVERGVLRRGLSWGGLERSYRLYRPAALDVSRPAQLVVMLHGGTQTADQASVMSRLDAAAERGGFLVAYPNGVQRTWNAGVCCGPAARLGVDDVGFVCAVVDAVGAEQPVDPARLFATGISNGGHLAYRLAVERSERFAAVAPVAGSDLTTAEPSWPVSILHIHGAIDQHVPYGGGVGPRSRDPVDYRPARTLVQRWVRMNGCGPDPAVGVIGPVTRETWTGTLADVELVTLAGTGHWWPGGRLDTVRRVPVSFDATAAICEFFAAHPKA